MYPPGFGACVDDERGCGLAAGGVRQEGEARSVPSVTEETYRGDRDVALVGLVFGARRRTLGRHRGCPWFGR